MCDLAVGEGRREKSCGVLLIISEENKNKRLCGKYVVSMKRVPDSSVEANSPRRCFSSSAMVSRHSLMQEGSKGQGREGKGRGMFETRSKYICKMRCTPYQRVFRVEK